MTRELARIFKAHELIWYLIEGEQKIQHRDKLLGNLWLLLNPVMMMVVLFLVFRNMRQLTPAFCLYLFSGVMIWDIFSKTMVGCAACIPNRVELILKYPLPLSIFPISVVLHKVYDVLCGLIAYIVIFMVIVVLFASGLSRDALTLTSSWAILAWFPVWLFFFLLMMLGFGFILARIGVYFADIRDLLEVLLRLGFFINPVFLEMHWLGAHLHHRYLLLNPIGGFLLMFRRVLPGGDAVMDYYHIPIAWYPYYLAGFSIVVFIIGFIFFVSGTRDYAKYI